VSEPHRDQAIKLLARGLSLRAPTEHDLRLAADIVDAIAAHGVEVHRDLVRAEAKLAEGKPKSGT